MYTFLFFLSFQLFAQKTLDAEKKDGKWGFVKKKGKFVVGPIYDTVFFEFTNDVAGVGIIDKGICQGGLINKKGEKISEFRFYRLSPEEDYILVENQEHFLGILNWEGKVLEENIYKKVTFKDDFFNGESFASWDVFNLEGKIVSKTQADSISCYNSQVNAWRNGHMVSLHNLIHGNSIQKADLILTSSTNYKPKNSQAVSKESADTLFVYKEEAWYGFVDTSGKIRISIQYDSVKEFSEGMAPVKILGKWAFINKKEQFIIQPSFEDAWPFEKGTALVKIEGKYNFIDKNGELRNGKGFDMVEKLETGNLMIRSGNSIGLADSSGKEMIIPKYEDLKDLGNGYVIIKKHGLLGVLNYQQDIIVPCQYLSLKYLNNYFAAGKSGSSKVCKRLFD